MTKQKCVFFTILLGALLVSPAVQASSWSTIASSCEPGSDSIGFYSYSNGTFRFATGATGKISTRCQINNPLDTGVPAWNTLTVGFVDPDGRGGNYEVQVLLQRVAKSTGVHTVIATLDSDAYGSTGAQSQHITFTHTFDFINYAYYIGVDILRGDTNGNPGVWFASLK